MTDWRIPGDATPDDSVPFEPDAWTSAAEPATDGLADPVFADPFSDEIAGVDGSEWDADLLWGPDPLVDGGDLDLPL